MIADVTHYTLREGGNWLAWPFADPEIKPSSPELLTWPGNKSHYLWHSRRHGVAVRLHALRLSDGREWDSINRFRTLNPLSFRAPNGLVKSND